VYLDLITRHFEARMPGLMLRLAPWSSAFRIQTGKPLREGWHSGSMPGGCNVMMKSIQQKEIQNELQ
jgi:hypothetical protein